MNVTAFDHVHIYARDVEHTIAFYQRCFGAEPVGTLAAGDGRVHRFVILGGQYIAISPFPATMQPRDAPPVGDGAVQSGFGIAHVGLNVDDIDAAVAHLRRNGVDVHGDVAGAGALRYVYASAPDGVIVELTQYVLPPKLAPGAKLLALLNSAIHAMRRTIARKLMSSV
ncbi:MAG: VOC family protein [Myxococcales bacterium]|nr:VOC family protein [Myxococcales bacterium]